MIRRGSIVLLAALAGSGLAGGSAMAAVVPADIEVLATGPSAVPINTQATYTVTVRNIGPHSFSGVDIYNEINFSVINWQPTWGSFVSLTCDKGKFVPSAINAPGCVLALAAGETATLKFTVKASEIVRSDAGILFQASTYTIDHPDPNEANNRFALQNIKFVAPGTAPPPPPPPGANVAPVIANVTLSGKPATGMKVAMAISEAVPTLVLRLEKRYSGRKRNGKCRRTNKKGATCTYFKDLEILVTTVGAAGVNVVALRPVGKTSALKPGVYRVWVRAKDAGGLLSNIARSKAFTVKKKKG